MVKQKQPVPLQQLMDQVDQLPKVDKHDVYPGDYLIVHTQNSIYTIRVLAENMVEVRGGWFDRKGLSPFLIGISGATWGGSAIMPGVMAACGMRMEFQNRVITSPVKTIAVIPGRMVN